MMRLSGPVEPLPLPNGAVMLERPMYIKTGTWVKMSVDAYLRFRGITWARVTGGFGNGQKTGWHPREDWIGVIPEASLHVSRYFDKPYAWNHRTELQTIREAMLDSMQGALWSARQRLVEREGEIERLDGAIKLLRLGLT